MRRRLLTLAAACAAIVPVGLTIPFTTAQAAPSQIGLQARNVAVCPTPQNTDTARCHAVLHEYVDSAGRPVSPNTSGQPAGYGPADLQSAYALAADSAAQGGGRTVAIVDAYDDPNAQSDLGVYRSQYGLPTLAACTVTSTAVTSPVGPCFAKVNQNGGTGSYPRSDGGWAQEESLDVDMVSAICPNCNIVLVEASSASFGNLGTAVDTAANFHAIAISNSYGSSGDLSDNSYGSYYDHPGIAITASTGDNGYGVGYPATSQYTVAVGGTTLTADSTTSRGWSETAWSGAGSGCSTYQSEPAWQTVPAADCNSMRAIADVSADADPNTGVAVYDSYAYQGASGWLQFGGTSVASPIIASVYALAGSTGATSGATGNPASFLYAATGGINDVVGGSNGSCSLVVLCTGVAGWDGPTGLGTPSGVAAFGGTNSGSGGSGGGGTTTTPAPTGLQATAGDGSVSLSWTAPSGSGYTYNVYRSVSSGAELSGTPIASGLTSTTYTDGAVSNGQTYYYEVTAVASGTESAPSNEASATPTASTTVTMSVVSLQYAMSSNGKALLITVPVTDPSLNGVPGASVSVTIDRDGAAFASGSGTTGSNGSVTFRVNHATAGTYLTVINSVTATGYTWDNAQPSNASHVVQ